MKDSEASALQPQVTKSLQAQLADLEAELVCIPEPDEDDYKSEEDFKIATRVFHAEVKGVWQKIHRLMRSWPAGA